MTKTWRIVLVIVFVLVGAAFAGALWLEHHGESAVGAVVRPFCGQDETSGCEAVRKSAYSQIGGWPLAAAGVFYYGSLLLLLCLVLLEEETRRPRGLALALILAASGIAVDLVLVGIQAFSVRAFCTLCVLSYVGSIGAFILLLPAQRALAGLAHSPLARETRLLLGAWAAGSVILLAGVASSEVLLDNREVLADPAHAEQYFIDKSLRRFASAPVHHLDLSNAPTAGQPNAPIQAVLYSDFLCPWCRQLAAWLGQYVPHVQDRLSITFKHYPLDQTCNAQLKHTTHPGSCAMALGAVCAAEQGRFWQYHNSAFSAGLEKAVRSDAVNAARQAGLDMAAFERCLDSPAAAARLAREIEEARVIGITGTPTVVVNGKLLDRAADLPLAVQAESARLGLDKPRP